MRERTGRPLAVAPQTQDGHAASGRTSLLVADDSSLFRTVVQRAVGREPALQLVGIARDGGDALLLMGMLKPDVALLDWDMPVLSGLEVVRSVRSIRRRQQVALMTASPTPERMAAAAQAGVVLLDKADGLRALLAQAVRVACAEPPRDLTASVPALSA